ncbi:NAD(P)H-dependent oxidoreductase [Paenibacillaceae bacterium WGS1546]|uniref:NAD(P)H-dependent oxidoreductase n=1 Tax=Cohnella sp. WGS1546 TaxID=3366810 RepID=UPI00372D45FD
MNHLIIYAHDYEGSYNSAVRGAILHELREHNQTVAVRDLYQLSFNPILTTQELYGFYEQQYPDDVSIEQEHIRQADILYFVFPTWWYSVPAILKGYFDRVFATGFAFRYSKAGPIGLLTGKKAFVFQTAADPVEALQARHLDSAMQAAIGVGILHYCGLDVMEHKIMPSIHHASDDNRREYLSEISKSVARTIQE